MPEVNLEEAITYFSERYLVHLNALYNHVQRSVRLTTKAQKELAAARLAGNDVLKKYGKSVVDIMKEATGEEA